MKRLSNIQESVWGNISKRSDGSLERKEDIHSNIKELIPIDIGCSVLWADRDFEYDDEQFFFYNDIKKYIGNSSWRLPTKEECEEFCNTFKNYKNSGNCFDCYNKNNDEIIRFDKKGYIFVSQFGLGDSERVFLSQYECWTSTERNLNIQYTLIIGRNTRVSYTGIEQHKFPVRLVKDKTNNVNESVWGNISKRADGTLDRKEDDINSLDRDGLYEYIFSIYEPTRRDMQLLPYKPDKNESNSFGICLFEDNCAHRLYAKFDGPKLDYLFIQVMVSDSSEFYNILKENFHLKIKNSVVYIYEKDGTISNKTCMNLIETVVNNFSKPLLKKREN